MVVKDRPLFGIKSERIDHTWATVREVHRAAVRTPAETIGDRQPTHDQLGSAVTIKSVEGGASWSLIIGNGPCPEAALRIAGRIVHPSVFRRNLGDGLQRAIRSQVAEALFG